VLAHSSNDLTDVQIDAAVKAGGSWTRNTESGGVLFGDLVTTRTTTDAGADTTDWRFTIIIPNLQYKIYAHEQTFLATPFDRAVVLADGSGPGPIYGVTPLTVKSYAVGLVDDWVRRGLSTDRDTIVAGITAEINSSNAGRIDLLIPDVPSAGLRVLATKLEWAFLV
jgi:phage tail sheath gpL-like